MKLEPLSRRAYRAKTTASSWEELWEAEEYYDRVSELLEDASQYAIFVGWQLDSRLPLRRPVRPNQPGTALAETLKEKVIRICEARPDFQVYFLIWDHAYFYTLEREALQGRVWDDIHPRIHFIFDNRHPFGGSHHEKVVIIDGRISLCGGIDLCDDRWDSLQHFYIDPRRSLNRRTERHGPYHDMGVQVTGPICRWIQSHIARRWQALSSIPFPESPASLEHLHGGHQIYFSRTACTSDIEVPGAPLTREIEFLFRDLIRLAQKRIILEGQYYWSETINNALIAKLHQMRGRDFEIVIVLAELSKLKSLSKQMAYRELTLLEQIQRTADFTGARLTMGTPWVVDGEAPARAVYVHSKVMIIDDRFLSIGSANFSERALRLDSELTLTLEATEEAERLHIQRVTQRILEHWNISNLRGRDTHLRHFQPPIERRELSTSHPQMVHIPWHLFFDPKVPWFHFFKRRYRSQVRSAVRLLKMMTFVYWLVGAFVSNSLVSALSFRLGSISLGGQVWPVIYTTLLFSAWLLPLPLFLISVLASLHLGPQQGPLIVVVACWIASLWGYALARSFPGEVGQTRQQAAPRWLSEKLGHRNFPSLVAALLDPRASMRSKIAYEGIYCVPLPWIFLANGLFLPSILYLVCRTVSWWALRGPQADSWVIPTVTIVLVLRSMGLPGRRIDKSRVKEKQSEQREQKRAA